MFSKLNGKQKHNWVFDRRKRQSAVMLSIVIVAISLKKPQEDLYSKAPTILMFHRIYILTENNNTSMIIFSGVNGNYLI